MTEKTALPAALSSYPLTPNRSVGRSVGDAVGAVFPSGPDPTLDENGAPIFVKGQEIDWSRPPATAPDLFAIVSHLLEISGAFSYYSAGSKPPKEESPVRLWMSSDEIEQAVRVGNDWSKEDVENEAPEEVKQHWEILISHWNWPINGRAYQATKCSPAWWGHAYFLFIVADEASKHVGFPVSLEGMGHLDRTLANYFEYRDAKAVKQSVNGSDRRLLSNSFPTMCRFADPDVVCVQPKSLVSNVGGGTRVFSHHLASLRPRGLVRTQWASATYSSMADDAAGGLNLLLVPMPYDLSAADFEPTKQSGRHRARSMRHWRTFKLIQNWLRTNDPATHVLKLLDKARAEGHEIHGVVLPELALDFDSFERLSDKLRDQTSVEFLVAGCIQDCERNHGNYVWCSRYDRDPEAKGGPEYVFIQSKHHRWKLDKSQINRYKIQSKLTPNFDWWEHINVGGRELNFASFRSNSVFATIVCEDLARSEPCHEILRSIGPNLLFALLMDGPQFEQRWPSRYSSYLSEDPGIGVLTLTSKGLIRLSDTSVTDCCIAHFRDGFGRMEPITCPRGSDAVILRLEPCPSEVESIDGRKKNIVNWCLCADDFQIPISVS